MKKLTLIIMITFMSIIAISCNVPNHALMGYYQVGYDRTQSSQCNTFITLINSSEKSFLGGENETIFVYTLFFDDNEKYLSL